MEHPAQLAGSSIEGSSSNCYSLYSYWEEPVSLATFVTFLNVLILFHLGLFHWEEGATQQPNKEIFQRTAWPQMCLFGCSLTTGSPCVQVVKRGRFLGHMNIFSDAMI